ncbi:flippase-like domain-containing protein [Dehalobacter sp. DCM]|uniref:lysylphosphatidylglycerol synthase transmembrane domain-containing protein n=1 Tax=Dehalobacter sp. DCM TaxID=2907827 RepID=UPI0030816C5A|nr:flippase-like domain-containing protein [Dehalobacter sp. DCM]
MRNKVLNYILLLTIITVTALILVSSSEFQFIPHLKEMTDFRMIGLAVLCMLVFWLTDALIFKAILCLSELKMPLYRYLKLAFVGQYYNMITPFSAGGQPVQIYVMTNDYQVPLGVATSTSINKYMVFHFMTTAFALFMAVFNAHFVFQQGMISKALICFGLALNVAGVIAIFLICYNSTVVERIARAIIKLLQKFRLAKSIDDDAIAWHIAEYKNSLKQFFANKRAFIRVTLYSFIQVTAYFAVTYFVYLSLGLSGSTFFEILAVQSILYSAANVIPTPGNAGASEGIFYLLFGLIFPKNLMISAIILWRLTVFYLNLVISGIIVFIDFLVKRYRSKSACSNIPH